MSRSNRPPHPRGQTLDYTPKAQKAPEVKIDLLPCMVCHKAITDGYYGHWGDNGTCSKKCEQVQEAKYPLGEYTEEAFLRKFGLE